MSTRYLIIGDGPAGTTSAQTIRQNDPAGIITLYSTDPSPAYFRAALTNYLIGELNENQLWAVPPDFYQRHNIQRFIGRAVGVDPAGQTITLKDNPIPIPYDKLLIATGSRANPAPFPNGNLTGVMTLRTLQDARQVMKAIQVHGLKRAVIVGAGPLGLEWVQGLLERGVHVTYLLRRDHLMRHVLDKTASDLTLARLRLAGVDVRVDEVAEVIPGRDNTLTAIHTKQGHKIACQLLGLAIGVTCNSDFLADSGLKIAENKGIVVNDKLETNLRNIYAAGDVACHNGTLRQLWEPAQWQGKVAGMNMSGREATYQANTYYFATRLFDLDFASVGTIFPQDSDQTLLDFPQTGDSLRYRKLILRDGRLIGALLLGARRENVRQHGRLFKRLITNQTRVTPIQDQLLNPTFDLAGWLKSQQITAKPKPTMMDVRPSELKKVGSGQWKKPLAASRSPLAEKQPVAKTPSLAPTPRFRTLNLPKAKEVASEQWIVDSSQPPVTSHQPPTTPPDTPHLAPRTSHPTLTTLKGTTNTPWLTLTSRTLIGRRPECHLVFSDSTISGRHAEIVQRKSGYYLRDLGSRNGTFYNGARLTDSTIKLSDGDEITFGRDAIIKINL